MRRNGSVVGGGLGRGPACAAVMSLSLFFVGAAWTQDPAPVTPAPAPAAPRPLSGPEIARRERLRESVEWLASPEREGRGPGTAGIEKAAEWLAGRFAALGLETAVVDGAPFQPFPITLESKLGPADENRAEIVGPADADGAVEVRALELGTDWTPLAAGGSGQFDLPLAFAGYGITAKAEDYDDYAPLGSEGAKGKGAIILRQEPQRDDPQSKFNGNQASEYAPLVRKIANASEHEVGGVVFCNDASNTDDALMSFTRAGDGSDRRTLPVIQVKRAVVDSILARATGNSLTELEQEIDRGPSPKSTLLEGFRIRGSTAVEKQETQARNVLALLPGVGGAAVAPPAPASPHGQAAASPHEDPPASPAEEKALDALEQAAGDAKPAAVAAPDPHGAQDPHGAPATHGAAGGHGAVAGGPVPIDPAETVIVGAHYDHLGYGGANSNAPGDRSIHHGADDNASGTAMLVEVARILAEEGPYPRTILFAAFSGEERGLLGSAHYTANAARPLADSVAMVNLDMVGRLDQGRLVIHGTGTGTGIDGLVDRLLATHAFDAAKDPGGFGPSDHASFYAKKIPVLHVFTGTHSDYHRPTDTAEKINYDGMSRIARMVAEGVKELARGPRPEYVEVAGGQVRKREGDRPYFGSIPDFGKPGKGYAISGVANDSPAAKGGLQGGDVVVRIGDSAVTGLDDFDSALRKHKGGETVPVVVRRGEAEVTLDVTLGSPR